MDGWCGKRKRERSREKEKKRERKGEREKMVKVVEQTGQAVVGKVDPAELARGRNGLAGRNRGMRTDFMMFFDATALPARYEKRWSGNELESASSYPLFRGRLWNEQRGARGYTREAHGTHIIFTTLRIG